MFGLIGGGAALLLVLFTNWALGYFINWPKPIISVGCYACFILPVYYLQRRFAFKSKLKHKIALPRYISTQIISLVLNFILSFVAYNIFNLSHLVGSLIVVFLTSALSFAILKLWAFREGKKA